MNNKLKLLACTLLAIGCTTNLLAQQAGSALTSRVPTKVIVPVKPVAPGMLNGFTAVPAELNAGDALAFKFSGVGHCKIHIDAGNGLSADFEGELPFSAPYTYQNIGLNSFESFKKFKAIAAPQGICKASDDVKPVTVQFNNPTPSGVTTPPSPIIVSSQGANLKLGTPIAKVVATIKSVVLTTTAATGTPKVSNTMPVGAPMTITVNGTGLCKYSLDVSKLETPNAAQPHLVRASSLQKPFPITETMWPATAAGTYTWIVNGQEGCSGTAAVTIVAQ